MQPISFTFTGRKEFMKILIPYLLRERKASKLKKHVWFLHTNKQEDIDYAIQTTKDYPGFFEVLDIGIRPDYSTHLYQTAYQHFTEPGQVYIKIDDDIVFIEEGALGRLAKFKVDNPEYFIVLGNIINNGVCAHLHQRFGALVAPDFFTWAQDNNYQIVHGIKSDTAETSMVRLHMSFFELWKAKNLDRYKFYKWGLWEKQFWVSINLFAVLGDDLATLGARLTSCAASDECFLTEEAPALLNKANCIYGDCLVSHYSFRMQNEIFDRHPELLTMYENICNKECGGVHPTSAGVEGERHVR